MLGVALATYILYISNSFESNFVSNNVLVTGKDELSK